MEEEKGTLCDDIELSNEFNLLSRLYHIQRAANYL